MKKKVLAIENERLEIEYPLKFAQIELDDQFDFEIISQIGSGFDMKSILHFDLYLIDLKLGPASRMHGKDIIVKLRKFGLQNDKFIIITGHTDDAMMDDKEVLSGIQVIKKPVSPSELIEPFQRRLKISALA